MIFLPSFPTTAKCLDPSYLLLGMWSHSTALERLTISAVCVPLQLQRWDFQERPIGNLVNFTGEGKN